MTGVKLRIPYAALGGIPVNGVGVFAFINGSGHDFVSNQVIGGLNGGDDPGNPTNVNFANTNARAVVMIPKAGTGVLALLPLLGVVLGVVLRHAQELKRRLQTHERAPRG